MKQKLIILRGAPASGKSTIAKSLRSYQNKIVWLKVDNFKPFFAKDATIALDHVNGSALVTLKYLLQKKFSIVMEGVFQDPSTVDQAVSIAKSLNINHHSFELQSPLASLVRRDKNRSEVKRGHRKPMDRSVLENIYITLKENPLNDSVAINTEKVTAEELIDQLNKIIST